MGGVYATAREIASGKKFARSTADRRSPEFAGVDAGWRGPRSRLFDAKTLRKFYSRCAV
jgi:hypothetical protein